MAHMAHTLHYADETERPLFGLSLLEAGGVLVTYALARSLLPHALLHGLSALIPPLLVWAALTLTHKVRIEPYVDQLYGFVVRRVLGPDRQPMRPHAVLEVDGFTREALTDDQQDVQLVGRLQALIASLGAGGVVQLLVTNDALDHTQAAAVRARTLHAGTPALVQMGDRSDACAKLRSARAVDLHFYVVVYEPKAWRSLTLFRRADDADPLLDDLVQQARDTLMNMGLTSRRVTGIADPGGRVAAEFLSTVRLTDEQWASSAYLLWPPASTDPGWLDALTALPWPFRLAVWCHGLDSDAERARLARRQRHHEVDLFVQMLHSPRTSTETLDAVAETDEVMRRLRRGGGLVQCGIYVTVLGATAREARQRVRRVQQIMKGPLAGRPAGARGHQRPLYDATGPGRDAARRAWRMDAETAANTYPFNRANPTTRGGYTIGTTDCGELVRFDPADPSLRNALVVIFGLSGMGKTFCVLKLLAAHLRATGRCTVLDRSGHYEALAQVAGGVTVRTAEELDAVRPETPLVIVDLRAVESVDRSLRDAVDRRVQTPCGESQHCFVLEEGWQFEYLDAALWVNDLARRGRHWGGFVLWVTHDPADLLNHKVITSMFSAAATKIAFALDDKEGVASRLGTAMGLTPKQIARVKSLRIGECYLMRHNKLRGSVVQGTVRIDADSDEKWLFVTDPRSWQYQRRAQEVAASDGDVWAAVRRLADTVPFDDEEVA